MQAGAKVKWGSDQLVGKIVALQGCGNVGYHLAGQLHRAGAQLIASDIDPVKVARVVALVRSDGSARRPNPRRSRRHLRSLRPRRHHQRRLLT